MVIFSQFCVYLCSGYEKNRHYITADDGVVHVLIGILPVGEHTITVDTVASGNYAAGHNYDKSLEVIKGDLTITAGTSASSVDYGTEIVFTYDIDNPAGTTTGGKISIKVGKPSDCGQE